MRVATWTHSSYDDVWPMYFGQYEKYAPFFEHTVLINKEVSNLPDYCKQATNTETDPLYKRLVESLSQISDDVILFSLEDYVLYDRVDEHDVSSLVSFLRNSKYDFIRLLKSGIAGGTNLISESLGLYEVPHTCQYLFSLAATLWKKESLIRQMETCKPKTFMESEVNGSNCARQHNILSGLYVWRRDPLCEGEYLAQHCDSSAFPHICSALHGACKGHPSRWNIPLYGKRLNPLFEKYNIDPNIRGTL